MFHTLVLHFPDTILHLLQHFPAIPVLLPGHLILDGIELEILHSLLPDLMDKQLFWLEQTQIFQPLVTAMLLFMGVLERQIQLDWFNTLQVLPEL